MVPIDGLALIIGVVYGYAKPGKTEKMETLKKGAMYGAVFGIVLSVLNLLVGRSGRSLLMAPVTVLGSIIAVVYLTIFFVIGAWIGDFLEEKLKKTA